MSRARIPYQLCLASMSFNSIVYSASLASLAAVSADRFWAICHPISYHKNTDRVTNIIIVSLWALSISAGLLLLLGSQGESFYSKTDPYLCIAGAVLQFDAILWIAFLVCSVWLTMIVLYAFIYLRIVKRVC